MAVKNRLDFGMMRLPVHNNDPTAFNYEQINRMVDNFISAGFTYFDTSYVYHNGKSEEATRKALIECHPRDSFTVATELPAFDLKHEEEIEPIFARQLENLGVDYIDYYLLHNVQTICYDGIDGSGGIMEPVKGGCLASAPQEAETLLKARDASVSVASWTLRFIMDLNSVLAVLSGMSTPEQVQENIALFQAAWPLAAEDKEAFQQVVSIYKKNGPLKTADFSAYAELRYHSAPVSTPLDTYNTCQLQPNPSYGCDSCYIKNTMAKEAHLDCFGQLPEERVVLDDGSDVTDTISQ